ncbi:MAG: DNA polymerase I [Oscillospiraceae bacterium]|nr:DNA polymerase I [Oscillospiraceae bacterium]
MTLMALDGNSLLNRAYYGVKAPLSTRDGQPTGALLGFCHILFKLIDDYAPDGLCVVFDVKAPTFRHEMYDGYKAGRRPMPEDLASQLPLCRELLDALCIKRYEQPGYEADDLLGVISRRCEGGGWDCRLVTGDRDAFQLVGERTQVLYASSRGGRSEATLYDLGAIQAEYGLTPAQLIDLKALMGDASDNIPGVAGVGEKTALALMHRFGSLDALYEGYEAADLKPGVKNKLRNSRDIAYLSQKLATIDCDAPLTFTPEEAKRIPWDEERLLSFLERLEFRKLIKTLHLQARDAADASGASGASDAADASARPEAPAHAFAPPPARELTIGTPRDDLQADLPADPLADLLATCRAAPRVAVVCPEDLSSLCVCTGEETVSLSRIAVGPEAFEAFLRAFFDAGVRKIAHGVKPLMRLLKAEDLPCADFVMDTALGAYLLAPSQGKYPIDGVIGDALDFEPESDEDRAGALPALAALQEGQLQALGLDKLLFTMELPLCEVLADMELAGCKVDRDGLRAYQHMLLDRLAACEERIFALAGTDFNIASPKQLAEILFKRLGLPAAKKTKTGYATDIEVLQKLKPWHPIAGEVIEYRQLSKLKSTYADGLLKAAGPDGRVRTSFQMTATATGRLSSIEPNLQNIPVRTDLGGELRRLFVPENDDFVLIDADYSQIELRVLAHIAGDTAMRAIFAAGGDIHTATAAQVFGVSPGEVTPLMRRRAKAVNFGIVYGMSAFSLSEDIGVTVSEARGYIDGYLEHFAGVRAYMKDIVETARRDGYVSTLLGRRRWLPELASPNRNTRAFGERVALNAPIQGAAADIIKLAMLAVWRRLKAEGLSARLILQVHDELIVECPRSEADTVRALLAEEMERVYTLNPPLVAEAHVGVNWLEAK